MSKDLVNCLKCNKTANYHDKQGLAYCEECYWIKDEETKELAKNRSFRTYDSAPTTFIKCPYCGCGDTCGYAGGGRKGIDCISDSCGFRHPEGKINCQICREKEQKEFEESQRKQEEEIKRLRDQQNKCFHRKDGISVIQWKEAKPYCINCQVSDNSPEFLNSLCSYHWINLKAWLEKHQINSLFGLPSLARDLYWKLVDGAIDKDKFTTQEEIQQAYQQIVKELNELARSKGITDLIEVSDNNDKTSLITQKDKDMNSNLNMNIEREREREQNQPKSNTLLYVSLGLGALALIGGLVYWFTRKNKKD